MKNSPLKISNITIQPGERINLALPTPQLYTCTPMYIPVHVIHGKKEGPVMLVCGSMHGDEINGVAITQRLLKLRLLKSIKGSLIVIPTLNIFGMISLTRNLPDRRDLEGSFPGHERGSFAARLAHLLTEEVFSKITHCIDLHTGEPHIHKFPQIKTSIDNPDSKELAHYFQAPVVIEGKKDEGLLWLQEQTPSIPTIIFETGEALRLNEHGIKIGVRGIVRVMRKLGMLSQTIKGSKAPDPIRARSERWVRAPSSGLCEIFYKIGTFVQKGASLATIADPFGTEQREEVTAPVDGIVIARNNLPILNEGEPILQIAEIQKSGFDKIQQWSEEQKGETPLE